MDVLADADADADGDNDLMVMTIVQSVYCTAQSL